jgi:hypothetical protein
MQAIVIILYNSEGVGSLIYFFVESVGSSINNMKGWIETDLHPMNIEDVYYASNMIDQPRIT